MKKNYKIIKENYKRTIVLGDIHGCFKEMNDLLNQIGFCGSDLVVSVGDIIDRGPFSWEVAQFFQNTKNAIFVLGNHERRLLGTVRAPLFQHGVNCFLYQNYKGASMNFGLTILSLYPL